MFVILEKVELSNPNNPAPGLAVVPVVNLQYIPGVTPEVFTE